MVHSTPLADDEEKKSARLKSIELIQKGGKNSFVNQMMPNLFSVAFKKKNPKLIEELVEGAQGMEDWSMINGCSAMMTRKDNTKILESAEFPIQWILGMDDNLIFYKKILQQCHKSPVNFVAFYNNCGHMSMIEAPGRLIGDLTEFAGYSYEYRRTG